MNITKEQYKQLKSLAKETGAEMPYKIEEVNKSKDDLIVYRSSAFVVRLATPYDDEYLFLSLETAQGGIMVGDYFMEELTALNMIV